MLFDQGELGAKYRTVGSAGRILFVTTQIIRHSRVLLMFSLPFSSSNHEAFEVLLELKCWSKVKNSCSTACTGLLFTYISVSVFLLFFTHELLHRSVFFLLCSAFYRPVSCQQGIPFSISDDVESTLPEKGCLCGNLPPVRQALRILAGCHAAGVGSARCCFASSNN